MDSNLCNQYLIGVIRDFWTFSEISQRNGALNYVEFRACHAPHGIHGLPCTLCGAWQASDLSNRIPLDSQANLLGFLTSSKLGNYLIPLFFTILARFYMVWQVFLTQFTHRIPYPLLNI
jgi:hypothetical protein